MAAQQYSQDPIDNLVPTYGNDLLPSYSENLASYSEAGAASAPMSNEDMLRMAVPGEPGEDYPIYAEIPETGFDCEGRVDGGYYADPEAECQAFHVCSAGGQGAFSKYSFLCPNGTLFNQENFVCEYWFSVDCSKAESLYGLNDAIGLSDGGSGALDSSASSSNGGYAAPGDDYAVAASASVEDGYAAPIPVYGGERRGRKEGKGNGRETRKGKRRKPFGGKVERKSLSNNVGRKGKAEGGLSVPSQRQTVRKTNEGGRRRVKEESQERRTQQSVQGGGRGA